MINGNWKKWTINLLTTILASVFGGVLCFLFITVLPTMADNIIKNDKENIKQHIEIRKEREKADKEIAGLIDEKITRIDNKLESYQREQRAVNFKILDKLDKIRDNQ